MEVFETHLILLIVYVLLEFYPPPSRSLPGACRVTPLGNSPDFAPAQSPANAGEDIKWLYLLLRHSLGGRDPLQIILDSG
ncbi:hypothetical protein DS62_08625 [Smithella sp. SC_K08D17]|nr:hypothetical protein KD27_06615 [Smithella sp. D17]KIE17955.1 hypothetical protein DS62_08625 [Smithella sp. SC_K08D17]